MLYGTSDWGEIIVLRLKKGSIMAYTQSLRKSDIKYKKGIINARNTTLTENMNWYRLLRGILSSTGITVLLGHFIQGGESPSVFRASSLDRVPFFIR